jgi:two-component system, NarL family, sensor kinase
MIKTKTMFRIIGFALTLLVSICFCQVSLAQSTKVDSLKNILDRGGFKSNEDHLRLLSEYSSLSIEVDLLQSIKAAKQQLHYSYKYNLTNFEAEANEKIGRILYLQGRNDSALFYLNQAIAVYSNIPNSESKITEAKNFMANVYRIMARYDEAIEIYNESLVFYENNKDNIGIAKVLANIGSLYYSAGNQPKGEEYTLKALELQRTTGDTQGEVVSLVNLLVFALNNNNFELGIKYGEEAIQKLETINIAYYAAALLRVGYCYYMIGQKGKAINFTNKAIEIYKRNNSVVGLMESYRTLADYYMDMKRYADAKNTGLIALEQADTTNRLDLRLLYDLLKRSSIYLNHHDDAILYSSKQLKLKEEDTNSDWAEKIAQVEAIYQTEKKDIEIKQLQSEKQLQKTLLISLFSIIILGSLVTFFFFKNVKQKRVLADQKILQIENEKKLVATHALLEGENAERTRLSKDLHDGLGGLLSVAKHKISNMKGSLTIPEEQVEPFNSALDLLDKSIRELRRVAHNLMPESLVRYGLNSAIKDLCNSIENVQYHFFGTEKRIDDKLEVAAFRIISELVNNAIKHSNATHINVQLIQEYNRLSINVHDNGIGFDPKSIKSDKSAGISNIKSRVTSFNGHIDILSTANKGTEVSVEFNID